MERKLDGLATNNFRIFKIYLSFQRIQEKTCNRKLNVAGWWIYAVAVRYLRASVLWPVVVLKVIHQSSVAARSAVDVAANTLLFIYRRTVYYRSIITFDLFIRFSSLLDVLLMFDLFFCGYTCSHFFIYNLNNLGIGLTYMTSPAPMYIYGLRLI